MEKKQAGVIALVCLVVGYIGAVIAGNYNVVPPEQTEPVKDAIWALIMVILSGLIGSITGEVHKLKVKLGM